ncbi:diguanylate cyclase [Erythrobacter sp. G21629-S1]|nr:diguanylate cyclase [Erythrobacter sp. G21629-S1]
MFTDNHFEDTVGHGLTRVPVDPFEIEREAVIAMLDRERRSLPASLIAISLLAIGVTMLPNVLPMLVLLALRTLSFLYTRQAAARLERIMRARQPARAAHCVMIFAMALTGMTLALMLWPQPEGSSVVAITLIGGVVVVALTLIAVTLAALPRSRDAMLASFWLTALAMTILHPQIQHPELVGILALIVIGIRIYSASTGEHIQSAAKVLVENRQLSEDLADALAHAEFLSWRDPLTGLFNRRKLFEETRIERSTQPRHLMTIDLDRFKAINDTYGHGVGDHVLIATADAIREWGGTLPAAAGHQAFRLGGEEFLVITRGLDDGAAADAAERLRSAIAQIARGFTEHPDIRISASIGLTGWRFGEGLDDALLRADAACYEAKNTGRNRVRRAA